MNFELTAPHFLVSISRRWVAAAVAASTALFFVLGCGEPAANGNDEEELARTMELTQVIDLGPDCLVPGYITVYQDMAYVTCGGTWGENEGRLVIIDLSDMSIAESTHLGGMPGAMKVFEEVLVIADGSDGRVFVTDLLGDIIHDHEDPVVLCPSNFEENLFQSIAGLAESPEDEILASCFSSSEVVRFRLEPGAEEDDARNAVISSRVTAGDGAGSLARWGEEKAIVLDGLAGTASLVDLEGDMEATPFHWQLGETPNDIIIDEDRALVVNSTSQTLQVLDLNADPSTATIHEVFLGDGTNPMSLALLSRNEVLVTLWLMNELVLVDLDAGGIVARAGLPSGEDLLPLGEMKPSALPQGVALTGDGRALVALNNMDEDMQPAGHGIVAIIEIEAESP